MGIPEHTSGYSLKGCIITFIVIFFGIIGCTVGATAVFDGACVGGAEKWLPEYPGAETVEQSYTFLRMWGIGTSEKEMMSEDEYLTVRAWYHESDNQNSFENAGRGGASLRWNVSERQGGGAIIRLRSECAKELDLSPLGIGRGGN